MHSHNNNKARLNRGLLTPETAMKTSLPCSEFHSVLYPLGVGGEWGEWWWWDGEREKERECVHMCVCVCVNQRSEGLFFDAGFHFHDIGL